VDRAEVVTRDRARVPDRLLEGRVERLDVEDDLICGRGRRGDSPDARSRRATLL
jgi:hypothetical protein